MIVSGSIISQNFHTKPNFSYHAVVFNYCLVNNQIGFAFGAIGIGFLADLFGLIVLIYSVAFLAIASGIFVLVVMKETSRLR